MRGHAAAATKETRARGSLPLPAAAAVAVLLLLAALLMCAAPQAALADGGAAQAATSAETVQALADYLRAAASGGTASSGESQTMNSGPVFSNGLAPGSLRISKSVTGNSPDSDKKFKIHVKLNVPNGTELPAGKYRVVRGTSTVTVHFDANGGTGSMDDATGRAEEEIELPECTMTAPSHRVFAGWNDRADGTGNAYADGATAVFDSGGEVTLYAIWDAPATLMRGNYYNHEEFKEAIATAAGGSLDNVRSIRLERGVEPGEGGTLASTADSLTPIYAFYDSATGAVTLRTSALTVYASPYCGHMFQWMDSLASVDLSGLDTSKVTNMSYMFDGCSSLTSLDLSGFDTSKVTDMSYMFYNCTSLTSLDLSGFDTSKVETYGNTSKPSYDNMAYMFYECPSLSSVAIGEKFKFNFNNPWNDKNGICRLPDAPSDETHNGMWTNGTWSLTATDLQSSYNGEAMAGTWRWQRTNEDLRAVVHFDANGGEGEMDDMECALGECVTCPENAFSRDGYFFSSFYFNDGKSSYTAYTGSNSEFYAIRSDMTFRAQWVQGVTLHFDANGGEGEMDDQLVKPYDVWQIPSCGYAKSGAAFAGWNTSADGGGDSIEDGGEYYSSNVKPGDTLVLYAQWSDQ